MLCILESWLLLLMIFTLTSLTAFPEFPHRQVIWFLGSPWTTQGFKDDSGSKKCVSSLLVKIPHTEFTSSLWTDDNNVTLWCGAQCLFWWKERIPWAEQSRALLRLSAAPHTHIWKGTERQPWSVSPGIRCKQIHDYVVKQNGKKGWERGWTLYIS